MSKIDLLYIIEGGHFGGAEQTLLTVISTIDKTQYKISVCLLKPSDVLENELRELDIPVFVLDMAVKWDIFSIFKLMRFMRREKINIVHTSLYASNTFGRIAAILARIPIIIAWEHGEVLRQNQFRHYKIDKILANFTDAIVACSKICKEALIINEHIPSGKIRVIYNCVDLDKFNITSDIAVIKKQLGVSPDDILIGTVATLSNEKKGQAYSIKAMPEIIKIYPNIKLLLVGSDGSSKLDLMQLADRLNIKDKIIFTGFRRDIPQIMKAIDIYVCTSNSEALGISIIEAMAYKKPVVATRVGGITEVVIDNQTGYLVAPKDINSIAQGVISLLANREKMRQMGEAGFERVKTHFSLEIIKKEMESLYKELLWKKHLKFQ